jgi:ADP-ribosylglycohydrolase
MNYADRVRGAVLGHALGDALGVPVEFRSREALAADPVMGPRGFGTHRQPLGTWSDDTSLMLCLFSCLDRVDDYQSVARAFVAWLDEGFWTPHGRVFDIGGTTRRAIDRLRAGIPPLEAGGGQEGDNGNGSLMRILPLGFLMGRTDEELVRLAGDLSSLTHRHPRSRLACGLMVLAVRRILDGAAPREAIDDVGRTIRAMAGMGPLRQELVHFDRALDPRLAQIPEANISSGGYVVHTLEAAFWMLLTSRDYRETVLRAVNLGEDTDTTTAVAGGLAGAMYGASNLPEAWLQPLARRTDIETAIGTFLSSQ